MPKKMRRKANRNALLAKLMDNEVRVIDSIAFKEPKTKAFEQFLAAIKVDKSALIALPFDQDASLNARLSGRNVDSVTMVAPDQLTAFSMLNHRFVVIGKSELEAWLQGPGSQTGKAAKVSPMGRKTEEASK
jgi:large subunit ribosomal protein L4